jgi:PEP-CTERM motif
MTRFGLVFLLIGSPALHAATISGAKDGNPPTSLTLDPYTVSLTPVPVQHISTGDPNMDALYTSDLKVMNDAFSNFKSSKGTADAPGTFDILQYQPFIVGTDAGNVGGANFSVLYDDGVAQPDTSYEWVQIAHYHNWGTDGTGTKVDGPPKTRFPFYYRLPPLGNLKVSGFNDLGVSTDSIWSDPTNYPDQKIQNPAGGGKIPKGGDLLFVDQPYCLLTCADADNIAYAYFDLFLVKETWNGKAGADAGGTVTVLDGIRWGVEITKSPQTFTNPGNIPEPSTSLLIGTGLIAAALVRIRRRKS